MPSLTTAPKSRGWFELRCRIPAGQWAELELELENQGAASITLTEGDTTVCDEPGVHARDRWSSFEVRALFDARIDHTQLIAAIRNEMPAITAIDTVAIEEQAWEDVWKAEWQPQMFAEGLCVCPRWCDPPAGASQVVYLDPGCAFGTGMHETTALCLDWLARCGDIRGRSVVDFGCGSGILACAAARLRAARTYAVDIDEDALAVARDNAAYNELDINTGHPRLLDGISVDVIVANILLDPLLALEPRFAQHLHDGGRIVLLGLLATQTAAVLDTYRERFTMDAPVLRGEWALLAGRRR